ncbi:MAG TPA: NADPH-dependent FMN reductase [Solirubrobacterales bacterium]|nr:NADPH-dependent FMN reductase [Solirubrobacterales bacterium]
MERVQILLVSGSLRGASTNSALLRTAAAVAPEGVTTTLYEDLAGLPHFNPDDDAEGIEVPAPVAALRARLGEADAVLFCTPEYAGALPGSFKNLLEWTVGGHEIYRLPAAWVNAAAPGRGENADESLRKVLGYVGADIAEPAVVRIPVPHQAVDADGMVADQELRQWVAQALAALADHVRSRRSDPDWVGAV